MKKSYFLVIVVIGALVAGVIYYSKNSKNYSQVSDVKSDKPIPTEQPAVQAATLLANSKIDFPKILSTSLLTDSEIPTSLKPFVLSNASDLKFMSLKYAQSQSGIFILYTIKNSSVLDLMARLNLETRDEEKFWLKIAGASASAFAFSEFRGKNSGIMMRILLIQDISDIKVQIKTLNKLE